ncbi:DUF2071 domain-containing protein [Salinadaptatus halalkaliphilus]|uniref:DUF2071 domain-containing protein n=1 Tax=Salinadaptatus halalkaliphilus TaxID=2419781 RepID=A0A4S3TMK6_9EURY|nr:DUF2071 domain-containing protein [Salinadaptatus halalkaliphilus]THE65494.1 DUF2071 domain-containing protein [Salinadaptatus halalkaliphilus]
MSRQRTEPARWRFGGGSTPSTPHIASMTWRHGLFAHWPVDPEEVRPHVPDQLSIETKDGSAWISVLPFVLTNVGIRGTPSILRTALAELNVRTYVRHRGDPGLFFLSIDLGNSLLSALVGRGTRLPVRNARMRVGADERQVVFSSTRSAIDPTFDPAARFSATYGPAGEEFAPDPGTLEYWLTERRRFYAPSGKNVLTGEIAHDPWPLQPATATIHENTMFEANGLPTPTDDPIVHYADELSMTGSIPRRI